MHLVYLNRCSQLVIHICRSCHFFVLLCGIIDNLHANKMDVWLNVPISPQEKVNP